MSAEEQPDVLHAALARTIWDGAPSVRLTYHAGDDSLVAEIVQAQPVLEIEADRNLIIDLDGTDPAAMPTAIYLTGVRSHPASVAATMARSILGDRIWAVAAKLVDGGRAVDVPLDEAEAAERREHWRDLVVPAMIGVEFTPGRIYAVLTDASATILDKEIVDIEENDPTAVAYAIAEAADALAARHPGTAWTCPVSVQLGGPVDGRTRVVEFYNKPLHDGDEPWKAEYFEHRVHLATGRPVVVFNDAEAFALHEARTPSSGRPRRSIVAVLVVRDGIGAKLLLDGEITQFPMEIGIFRAVPGADLDQTPDDTGQTIEARSGVKGIIRAVEHATGRRGLDLQVAAAMAAHDDATRAVFAAAGEGLARGVAAIQAVVNPQCWVVYGPAALVDERAVAGFEFLRGLRTAKNYLGYPGLGPVHVIGLPTTGPLGARAAALAALGRDRSGGR
jgi:predicted NBD/HSP70 family sugar kinase